ncbi:unnamed protein product [Moneuplotes crassus]|uniref:Uncharacterized protein n=1 Tax=Euplotes crassus TaxID=5936 RepID=A0AAD1X6X5_EUPCR|nr:unnamed protein product [Moneuplotes crassus]
MDFCFILNPHDARDKCCQANTTSAFRCATIKAFTEEVIFVNEQLFIENKVLRPSALFASLNADQSRSNVIECRVFQSGISGKLMHDFKKVPELVNSMFSNVSSDIFIERLVCIETPLVEISTLFVLIVLFIYCIDLMVNNLGPSVAFTKVLILNKETEEFCILISFISDELIFPMFNAGMFKILESLSKASTELVFLNVRLDKENVVAICRLNKEFSLANFTSVRIESCMDTFPAPARISQKGTL